MSELLSCPFCGGEIQVTVYDEEFYRLILGADYEANKDYLIEHVDRMAAALAKCPLEIAAYSSESEAIGAWNTRAVESASGLVYIPSFRDNGEFPERIWASLNGEAVAYIRERTCKQEERGWGTEGDHARVWLTCGHDCMVPTVQDLPSYCPNCGAKVVSE